MADAGRLGSRKLMPVRRRRFLGQGLMLIRRARPAWVGAGPGPPFSSARQARRRTARRPGDALRARQFIADGVTLSSAATPNQPIRVAGMVVRTGFSSARSGIGVALATTGAWLDREMPRLLDRSGRGAASSAVEQANRDADSSIGNPCR